jgi:hypothetical protein
MKFEIMTMWARNLGRKVGFVFFEKLINRLNFVVQCVLKEIKTKIGYSFKKEQPHNTGLHLLIHICKPKLK